MVRKDSNSRGLCSAGRADMLLKEGSDLVNLYSIGDVDGPGERRTAFKDFDSPLTKKSRAIFPAAEDSDAAV